MGIGISFPGVLRPRYCVFTDTHGLFPSVWMMQILPQPSLVAAGTLSLTDGFSTISFPDCRVDTASIEVSPDGHLEMLKGFDFRWKWAFGEVSGSYNHRRPNGTIDPDTEQTPRELAALLFQAMGVTNADVSAFPENDRPYISWRCTRPRPELQKLLDQYGCSVVIDWSVPRPVVVRVGQGQTLPEQFLQTNEFGVDLSEAPSRIRLCCGNTLFQAKYKLTAIAEDVDGSVYPLESDNLSYRPAGGWEATVTDPADPLPDTVAGLEPARRTCYKWFRIAQHCDSSLPDLFVPGFGEINDIWQILPVSRKLLEQSDVILSGKIRHKRAYVEGTWWIDDAGQVPENTDENTQVPFNWSLERDAGILKFRRVMMKLSDDTTWVPADLFFVTSHELLSYTSGAALTYGMERQVSQNETQPLVVHLPELYRQFTAVYKQNTLTSVRDNQQELDAELNGLLDSLAAQYAPAQSLCRRYSGVAYIPLDGARRQVTYIVHHERGANRAAWLNTEGELGVPKLREQRRLAAAEA